MPIRLHALTLATSMHLPYNKLYCNMQFLLFVTMLICSSVSYGQGVKCTMGSQSYSFADVIFHYPIVQPQVLFACRYACKYTWQIIARHNYTAQHFHAMLAATCLFPCADVSEGWTGGASAGPIDQLAPGGFLYDLWDLSHRPASPAGSWSTTPHRMASAGFLPAATVCSHLHALPAKWCMHCCCEGSVLLSDDGHNDGKCC